MGTIPAGRTQPAPVTYVTIAEITGNASAFWTVPAGSWQVLTAKTQFQTDATAGTRFVSFQVIGPDGFEIYETQVTPSAGITASFNSFCFGAVAGPVANYTPTFNFQVPGLVITQDATGLWAAGFHNSGTVGAADLWHATRLLVARVA